MDKMRNNNDINSTEQIYEKRDARGLPIFAAIAIGMIILTIVIYALSEFFIFEKESLIDIVALTPESVKLREIRAQEAEILNSYAYIDSANGIVRIPIKRAMELMVREAYQTP